MNMTWFSRAAHSCTTTHSPRTSKSLRAMTFCTAIASSALFGASLFGSMQASAQQIQSLEHDGKRFPVMQASEAASLLTLPDAFGPTIGSTSVAPSGSTVQQVALLEGCDSGACDSPGGGIFSGLLGRGSCG
ncbi:unnamed protein product, partial [Hapterophycus canaliculatus]